MGAAELQLPLTGAAVDLPELPAELVEHVLGLLSARDR